MIIAKVLTPHRKGCTAVSHVEEKIWSNPWFLDGFEFRDKIGRNVSSVYRWVVIRCNSTSCPGKVIIREDYFLDQVDDLIL